MRPFPAPSLLLSLLAAGPAFSQTGAVRGVHDPAIICEGSVYYVFSTATAPGETIAVRRSRDLYTWEYLGNVFDRPPAWTGPYAPKGQGFWAPDISKSGSEYRLYYAISFFGTNHSAIGLAVTGSLDPASPDHRWVDRGRVLESREGIDDWNAIDPNFALDSAGLPWLAFGSYWSGIKLRRLDGATGLLSSMDTDLCSLAARPGSTAIEAPFIARAHGYFFLFVSWDQCCRGAASSYKTIVGRSESLHGPYRDRQGKAMLDGGGTLLLAGYDRFRGPGHCAVLRDGDREWLVHHYYDADDGGAQKLQIRPLLWTEDVWPAAGEPIEGPPAASSPPSSAAGAWDHSVDYGPCGEVHLLPGGSIGRAGAADTWSRNGSFLTLRWPTATAPGGAWVDRVALAPDAKSYSGRNQLDTIIRGRKLGSYFVRGDADGNGAVDVSDAILALTFLFQGSRSLDCLEALDANDDGRLDISDAIATLDFLFLGGRPIPPPGPPGGGDPTPDGLGC